MYVLIYINEYVCVCVYEYTYKYVNIHMRIREHMNTKKKKIDMFCEGLDIVAAFEKRVVLLKGLK